MKVNISYTVDLEDVLDEMTSLYHKSLSKLDDKLNVYDNRLCHDFKESQIDQIIMALEHNLESYEEHQTKIAEVLNILQGYKNIKNGDVESATPEEQVREDA